MCWSSKQSGKKFNLLYRSASHPKTPCVGFAANSLQTHLPAAQHLGYPVQVRLSGTALSTYCNCWGDLKQKLLEPFSNSWPTSFWEKKKKREQFVHFVMYEIVTRTKFKTQNEFSGMLWTLQVHSISFCIILMFS